MRFGISSLLTDYGLPPDEVARTAEAAGFDSLWVGDHTHIPASLESVKDQWWSISDSYWHNLDMFVSLAMAAAATTSLRIATGVCLLVQRDPIVVAKETATLDVLSGGRFMFGIGGGWNAEEMANHGTAFGTRWTLLRERAEVVRTIWTQEQAEYHGRFEDFDAMLAFPKPLQRPHPPIVSGGNGSKARGLAAHLGADWMPFFFMDAWPEIREAYLGLRRSIADAGGDPEGVNLIPYVLDEPAPEQIEDMAGLGVEQIVFSIEQDRDHEKFLRTLEQRAERFVARYPASPGPMAGDHHG
jgi:probable F420-dependent oxidoreductase